jgi:AraC-like DNA-binding protein
VPYRELLPSDALRPFVDRFWVRTAGPPVQPRLILPDGCIDVLLDLRRRTATVVGAMTQSRLVDTAAEPGLAAVRFRPGGAVPFLRTTAYHLTDQIVDVGELGLDWLPEPGFNSPAHGVQALEQALLRRLDRVRPPDPLVAFAVKALFGPTPPSVDGLARRIGWTRQHLRRALRDHVGVGGKTLARVARLHRAVYRLQNQLGWGLAQVADELGYYDQAHMARDFRALAGMPPAAVRAGIGSVYPLRSLLEDSSLHS